MNHVSRTIFTALLIPILMLVLAGPADADGMEDDDGVLTVVALGDSYIAGTGGGSYYDYRCWRTRNGWAQQYVDSLNSGGTDARLVNSACHGSVIADLGGQMSALDVSTDLVFVSSGGNDVSFSDIVKECFLLGSIKFSASSCLEAIDSAEEGLEAVGADLRSALSQVRAKAPNAHVVLLGYPYLSLDEEHILEVREVGVCKVEVPLAPDLYYPCVNSDPFDAARKVRALGVQGDTAQRSAAEASGADFVLVKPTFAGKEPDPDLLEFNPNRWIHEFENTADFDERSALALLHPLTRAVAGSWFVSEAADEIIHLMNESYHYNPTGHDGLGAFLAAEYGDFGAATDRFASKGGSAVDLVFVVDATGSMLDDIGTVSSHISSIVDSLSSRTSSLRLGLVTYRDHPDHTEWDGDYAARLDLGFTKDVAALRAAVAAIEVDGGGDWEETVLSGLMVAIDKDWRPGVKKIAVVLGDAPPHDPEPIGGLSAPEVVAASIAVDPVAVYLLDTAALTSEESGSALVAVADETGGEVLTASSPEALVDALVEVVDTVARTPSAWVGEGYGGRVGEVIGFSAAGSVDLDGSIASYEWDFNGDGVFEVLTDAPFAAYTYSSEFSGFVRLRVTDNEGQHALASASVEVDVDGDGVPEESDNCPRHSNSSQLDLDADGIGIHCDTDVDESFWPEWIVANMPPDVVVTLPSEAESGVPFQVEATASDDVAVTSTEWIVPEPCSVDDSSVLRVLVTCDYVGELPIAFVALDGGGLPGSEVGEVFLRTSSPTATPTASPSTEPTKTQTPAAKKDGNVDRKGGVQDAKQPTVAARATPTPVPAQPALAHTGTTVGPVVAIALLLMVLGSSLIRVARLRESDRLPERSSDVSRASDD